jgi:hypothetical protein
MLPLLALFFLFASAFEHSEHDKARVYYLESLTFPDQTELLRAHFHVPNNVALPAQVKKKTVFSFENRRLACWLVLSGDFGWVVRMVMLYLFFL